MTCGMTMCTCGAQTARATRAWRRARDKATQEMMRSEPLLGRKGAGHRHHRRSDRHRHRRWNRLRWDLCSRWRTEVSSRWSPRSLKMMAMQMRMTATTAASTQNVVATRSWIWQLSRGRSCSSGSRTPFGGIPPSSESSSFPNELPPPFRSAHLNVSRLLPKARRRLTFQPGSHSSAKLSLSLRAMVAAWP